MLAPAPAAADLFSTVLGVKDTFDWATVKSQVKHFEQKNANGNVYNLVTDETKSVSKMTETTNGVSITNKNSGYHTTVLLPVEMKSGDDFVFTADIVITSHQGTSRWIALSISNELDDDQDQINSHYQLVSRLTGVSGGITHLNSVGDAAGWTNMTGQVMDANPGAFELNTSYTMKAVVIDNVVDMYFINNKTGAVTQTLVDYDLPTEATAGSKNSAGYLGIECSGLSMDISNVTVKEWEDPATAPSGAMTLEEYEAAGYTIYRAKDGYTAAGKKLVFKEADAFAMYNSDGFNGFNKVSDGAEEDGYTAISTYATSGIVIPNVSAALYYGSKSGVKFATQWGATGVQNVMTPWAIQQGESFVYTGTFKIETHSGADRWMALTIGNMLNAAGDAITQRYQMVTRFGGTVAGMTKGTATGATTHEWNNLKHNNGAQAPIEALGTLDAGGTYTLLVAGKYDANKDVYLISSYMNGKTIMQDYELAASEVVGGYLGVEVDGAVVELDYDDTHTPDLAAYKNAGYNIYKMDETYDFRNDMQRYDFNSGKTVSTRVDGNTGVKYGLTGFSFPTPYENGTQLVFKDWKLKEGEDAVYSVDIKVISGGGSSAYLGLGLAMDVSADGKNVNSFYHTNSIPPAQTDSCRCRSFG